MPQNDRNRKRRRAYDQARDDRRGGQSTQRRSSAGAGSDLGYSGYAGYSSGGTSFPLFFPSVTGS